MLETSAFPLFYLFFFLEDLEPWNECLAHPRAGIVHVYILG